MPNHVSMALPAGSAYVFDSSVWHTSLPNTSGQDRRTALFSYRSSECHSGERLWGAVPGFSEPTLRRLDAEGKLTRLRRRVLGLPDEGTG